MKEKTIFIVLLIIFIVLGNIISKSIYCQLLNSSCPKYKNSYQNNGLSINTPISGDVPHKQVINIDNYYIYSAIAIDDANQIYFNAGGWLYCLRTDYSIKWRTRIKDSSAMSPDSPPVIDKNNNIYIGGEDPFLYCIDSDGNVNWKSKIGSNNNISSIPAIDTNGYVYIGGNDGYLYSFNTNGSTNWKNYIGGFLYSCPAIGKDGKIYFTGGGYLYSFNIDGSTNWRYSGAGNLSPAIGQNNRIYFGNSSYLYCINQNGSLYWRNHVGDIIREIGTSPSIGSDGNIYVGTKNGATVNYLFCFSTNGQTNWMIPNDNDFICSPIIGQDGRIYIGNEDRYFYCFHPNGSTNWRIFTDYMEPFNSAPVAAISDSGNIYFGGGWTRTLFIINTTLLSPSSLNGIATSTNKIHWSWKDNTSVETNYMIYNSANQNISGLLGINTTNWTQSNLSPNSLCSNYVQCMAVGRNSNTPTRIISTLASPPKDLQLVPGADFISLNWTPGNGGAVRYAIDRALDSSGIPGTWTNIIDWNNILTDTVYTNINLKTNTVYWYRVFSYNFDQYLSSSCEATNVVTLNYPPSLPIIISTLPVSTNIILIMWNDLSNETSYSLFRHMVKNTNTVTNILGFNMDLTNYYDNNLNPNTKYYYWLKAYNDFGESRYSAVASNTTLSSLPALPNAPGIDGLFDISTNNIRIVWSNVDNETSYTLFRNTENNTNTLTNIVGLFVDETNYTDNALSPETVYYYWIKAYNISGSSTFSSIASNRTLPLPPSIPSIICVNSILADEIDIIWNNVSNETSYTLFRNTINNENTLTNIIGLSFNQTNYNNTMLNPDTKYYYWVKAYNISGSYGFSTVASNKTLPLPPGKITNLIAISIAANQINLIWNNLLNITSYTLFRSLSNNTNFKTNIAGFTNNETNYNDVGLSPGTTYYYWIEAYNIGGSSGFSTVASNRTKSIENNPFKGGKVEIGPTTIFNNEKLYFANVTRDTKVSIYDVKGRLIWSADVTDASKCIQQGRYLYIKPKVIEDLADGLYIIVFKNNKDDPQIRKFNRISRVRR